MATYEKRFLSASTDGAAIKINTTYGPGNLIHTAAASATVAPIDEVFLQISNPTTTDQVVTVQFAATTTVDNDIIDTVPARSGLFPILKGIPIKNAKTIYVYAGATATLGGYGWVNRITP